MRGKGVIGAIVNSGMMSIADAREMAEGIVSSALVSANTQPASLGQLLDLGRLSLVGQRGFESALRTCSLLGDPATVLKAPPFEEAAASPGPVGHVRERKAKGTGGEPGAKSKYALIWQVLSRRSGGPGAPSGIPLPDLVLKATMVDRAEPCAIIQQANGNQRLVKVGDHIGGAEVIAINPGSVALVFDGRQMKIELHKR